MMPASPIGPEQRSDPVPSKLEHGRGSIPYHPGLHAIALLTAAATFPLIFMGGLVTSHGAGLTVPDWPNSFGYNMFALPWSYWVGGVVYEHTHRLMGSIVGMLSILLALWAWKTEERRWVRWLTVAVVGAVIVQGVLGGLRVVLVNLDLAIVHACIAQAFFGLAAAVAVVTSRWWMGAPGSAASRSAHSAQGLLILAGVALALIYLQLVAGAVMRHYQAGLAIPDFPLAYGHLVPPLDLTDVQLRTLNGERIAAGLTSTTTFQIGIHFLHRLGAVLVSIALVVLCHLALRRYADEPALRRPAVLLLVLLVAQLTLGVMTVLMRKPADVASGHVAVGALVLVTTCVPVSPRRPTALDWRRSRHEHWVRCSGPYFNNDCPAPPAGRRGFAPRHLNGPHETTLWYFRIAPHEPRRTERSLCCHHQSRARPAGPRPVQVAMGRFLRVDQAADESSSFS